MRAGEQPLRGHVVLPICIRPTISIFLLGMPNTPSIVIVKTMNYRGVPEEWSNKYHFSGTTPSNDTAWKALADAIIAEERKIMPSAISFTSAYGYAAGVAASVFQVNYADPPNTVLNGTGLTGSAGLAPGDVAFWVRWSTGARGATGKPIFLRKYFHGAAIGTSADLILASQRTAALAYGAKMADGTLPGGFKVCRPQGGDGGVVKVPTFLTTRTLKRRGGDPS